MKSQALRDSAKGQDCTLQIPGACNYDPATVVFVHFPDESHGMARKSDDISGGFGCSGCHDVIDRRVPYDFAAGDREWFMRRAQNRTMRRWIELGLVTVKGLK